MFFLDACYSGSATDDPLADEENVFGILTAASKKQTSMLSFVDYFSKQINAGKQLGEAYIRADAAIRGTSNTQDPAAVFKVDGQKVVVS